MQQIKEYYRSIYGRELLIDVRYVYFILEMNVMKSNLKGGNELKNVLISNVVNNISLPEMEVDFDNIEKIDNSNPANLKHINNLMMSLI